MGWLAVDKNGDEYIYSEIPERQSDYFLQEDNIFLPKGSIEKLIGNPIIICRIRIDSIKKRGRS